MTELRKALEALSMARDLIQEAKGEEGPNGGFVTNHLDAAEGWLDQVEAALASPSPPPTDDVRAELEGPFGAFQSTINPDRWYVSDERRKVAVLSTEIGASGEREARRVALLLNRDEQACVEGLSLCDSIKAAMGVAGVNARTLAALIGVTESRVSQLLRPNSNLTLRTLERIAEALGTRVHIALSAQLPPPIRGEGVCQSCGCNDGLCCINCGADYVTPSSPDWVLVPREPTQEMIEAGDDLLPFARGTETHAMAGGITPEKLWAAMLAASPSSKENKS